MKYKKATIKAERPADAPAPDKPFLDITQWGADDICADPSQIGKAGSPTNVKEVVNIVFKAKESKRLTSSDADIESLVVEMLNEKLIG